MTPAQRKTLDEQVRKGCQGCGKQATAIIVWSFEDTTKMNEEHPILAFIACDDHVDEVRARRPQAPSHIVVRITEESLKPLIFQ